MDRRGAAGAGGGGGTAAEGGGGVAAVPSLASSCWMRPLTKSEESSPHWGQTKRTGFRPMSGVTSTENLAPQEHCNFMSGFRIQQHHAGGRWDGKVQLSATGLYTAIAEKEIPAELMMIVAGRAAIGRKGEIPIGFPSGIDLTVGHEDVGG